MAGRDYTITGTLMDKDTGEAVMVNGNPVTASQTFTSDGTKKVSTCTLTLIHLHLAERQ